MGGNIEEFERESPGRRLGMLHRLSMAYLSGPLRELGLGRGKVGFLMRLFTGEGKTQDELTRSLHIDRAATARALQALEGDGLVRREEDPLDRRQKRVYLTEAALALRDRLFAVLDRHNEALFAGLDQGERREFLRMLDRLVANMQRAVGGEAE